MRNIIWIATNHLKLLARDKTAYILLLALPLALTLITGLAFNGGSSPGNVVAAPLALVDLDNSPVSRYIGESLKTTETAVGHYPEAEARELVRRRETSVALIIPAGFEASLRKGAPLKVTVIRADMRESPGLVEEQVSALLYRLRANAAAAALGEASGAGDWLDIFGQASEKWSPAPAVSVKIERVTTTVRDDNIPMGNNQASPGYVVMFGMMTVITAGGVVLLQERQSGTLARLLSAPLTRFQLLAGKALGLMAGGIVQMTVMITAGRILFNVGWGRDLPALALLVVALSFASTGFGMLLASVCRTKGQAEAVGVLAVLLMAMLGGTWWPVELLPPAMQVAAKAVPSGWAMEGFIALIMRQGDLAQVALPAAVLFAFGAAFMSLGVALFKYQD